jgi:hypothetical protein
MAKSWTLDDLNKVLEVKELDNFPRSIEARNLLQRLATAVAPVMKRRKWKVHVLKEFYPKEDGLLGMNVNRGQTVLVRLRPPNNRDSFYPWEFIIGTMIHELTHMEIGPHNSDFYRLMDEIADEVDKDQVNQLSSRVSDSASFTGQGHILGGSRISNKMDRAARAQSVANATIARLRRQQLTSGSVVHLAERSTE